MPLLLLGQERNEIVHFTASNDPTGKLVDLTVVRAFKNSLEAALPGDPLTPPARSPEPHLDKAHPFQNRNNRQV